MLTSAISLHQTLPSTQIVGGDELSSIQENLKDLKLESVKPGEEPYSGAGMSEEKKKEQEIELLS